MLFLMVLIQLQDSRIELGHLPKLSQIRFLSHILKDRRGDQRGVNGSQLKFLTEFGLYP
jgi:hypothetical protein